MHHYYETPSIVLLSVLAKYKLVYTWFYREWCMYWIKLKTHLRSTTGNFTYEKHVKNIWKIYDKRGSSNMLFICFQCVCHRFDSISNIWLWSIPYVCKHMKNAANIWITNATETYDYGHFHMFCKHMKLCNIWVTCFKKKKPQTYDYGQFHMFCKHMKLCNIWVTCFKKKKPQTYD